MNKTKNVSSKNNYFYFLFSLSLILFVGLGCKDRSSKRQERKLVEPPPIENPVDPPSESSPGNSENNTPGSNPGNSENSNSENTENNSGGTTTQASTLSINAQLPPISSNNVGAYTVGGTCNSSTTESVSIFIEELKTNPVEVSCDSNSFTGTIDARGVVSQIATIKVTHGNENTSAEVNNSITFSATLKFLSLPPLSSDNMNQYIISGTCDPSLGNVTIIIGKPNVEKDLPCDSRNTFLGNLNVENVSSHPSAIQASQTQGSTIVSSMDNNINLFVTKWNFPSNFEFTIPLKNKSSLRYNFTVDWGDNTSVSEVTSFDDPDKVHTYQNTGVYTIKIQGTCEGFQNTLESTKERLLEVVNLGNMGWKDLSEAFQRNIFLSNVFGGNTSNVTNMKGMFSYTQKANPNTEGWDTSKVTDMSYMFDIAQGANPDTSGWDTSKVTNMGAMFRVAQKANPETSGWDTSKVTDMRAMFALISKEANPDVSQWNTSRVKNMRAMFYESVKANPNTSQWDTSKVLDMAEMFYGATEANPDVSQWDISGVQDMSSMFHNATNANPDVSQWKTGLLMNVSNMFHNASNANPDTSSWAFPVLRYPLDNMFLSSGLSVENYSKFLISINKRKLRGLPGYYSPPSTKNINVNTLQYNSSAKAARESLISKGWTITDGDLEENSQ